MNYDYNDHPTSTSLSLSDGWILYYSSEGYPYYYNEYTGESQWAEYEYEYDQKGTYKGTYKETYEERYEDTYKGRYEETYTPPSISSHHMNDSYDSYERIHTSAAMDYSDQDSSSADDEDEEYDEEYDEEEDEEELEFQEYLQSEIGQEEFARERRLIERYAQRITHAPTNNYIDSEWDRNERHNSSYSAENSTRFISTYGLPPPPNHFSSTASPSTPEIRHSGRKRGGADLEGGERQDRSESDDEEEEVESDISSLSSDDPDMQVIKAPVVPVWITSTTNALFHILKRSVREPSMGALGVLLQSLFSLGSEPPIPPTRATGSNGDDEDRESGASDSQQKAEERAGWDTMTDSVGTATWRYLSSIAQYVVDGRQNEGTQEPQPS